MKKLNFNEQVQAVIYDKAIYKTPLDCVQAYSCPFISVYESGRYIRLRIRHPNQFDKPLRQIYMGKGISMIIGNRKLLTTHNIIMPDKKKEEYVAKKDYECGEDDDDDDEIDTDSSDSNNIDDK